MSNLPSIKKFEQFTDTRSRQPEVPHISIFADRGQISFNAGFSKVYPTTQVDFVQVRYYTDKINHYLAFVFSNDKNTPGAIKIYRPKNNFGTITLLSFFKKYSLNDKKYSRRYDISEQKEDGMTFYVVKIPYENK